MKNMKIFSNFLVKYLLATNLFAGMGTALWLDKSGRYRDLKVAVHPSTKVDDCQHFFDQLKDLSEELSRELWEATNGVLQIKSVDVVTPKILARHCGIVKRGTHQRWTNADIQLIQGDLDPADNRTKAFVTTKQPLGCGHPGEVIQIDSSILGSFGGNTRERVTEAKETQAGQTNPVPRQIGLQLLTSWAQYRWGVFHWPSSKEPLSNTKDRLESNQPAEVSTNRQKACENSAKGCDDEQPQGQSPKSTKLTRELDEGVRKQELVCGTRAREVVKKHPDFIRLKSKWKLFDSQTKGPRQNTGSRTPSNQSPRSLKSPAGKVTAFRPRSDGRLNLSSVTKSDIDPVEEPRTLPQLTFNQTSKGTSTMSLSHSPSSTRTTENAEGQRKRRVRDVRSPQTITEDYGTTSPEELTGFIGTLPSSDGDTATEVSSSYQVSASKGNSIHWVGSNPNQEVTTNSNLEMVSSDPESLNDRKLPSNSPANANKTPSSTKSLLSLLPPFSSSLNLPVFHSSQNVTWIKESPTTTTMTRFPPFAPTDPTIVDFEPPKLNFITSSPKTVVIALDLSEAAVTQTSVEWLRGGLLRWMFGLGEDVTIGIIASYSNTSFPLSLGPLTPGPSSDKQLEDYMSLLPYQHEVDDEVYGGLYCLDCVIKDTEKMLQEEGTPFESSVLVLMACEPSLPDNRIKRSFFSTSIPIHTIALCPNAPTSLERLAEPQGSWSLSPRKTKQSSFSSELQLGKLITKIAQETVLWPSDARLQAIYEEEKLLRTEDVKRAGAYRRVKGIVNLEDARRTSSLLVVITSSTPAKITELWTGNSKTELRKDTTRRYWALVDTTEWEENNPRLTYSLKYLPTSLDLPLIVSVGVYERGTEGEDQRLTVNLRTSTRSYEPEKARRSRSKNLSPDSDYLKVWADVSLNGQPIKDALVTLSVTYVSGKIPSTYSLMLLDDGSTEPDMTQGDGIYSRYLTWTPGPGRYVLTATASRVPRPRISSSNANAALVREDSGGFAMGESSSVTLIVRGTVPQGDIYPPSRITSLSVTPIGKTLVNVSWLAPGGDLDQGSAWRYQLKMYTEKEALTENNFSGSGIDVYCLQGEEQARPPAPALFGTPQHCLTSIPFTNLDWFFGIRAVDGANNTGRVSNIVSAFVFEPTTTTPEPQNGTRSDPERNGTTPTVIPSKSLVDDEGGNNWRLYGAALIGAVGLVMLAISVFACFICCRRAKIRAAKDPERPIYKIYVNNAYIQEEDGEIKVVSKEKVINEKDHTQQWVNSLDKYSSTGGSPREETLPLADSQGETQQEAPHSPSSRLSKAPIRFGVLTNGSIMREVPPSSSSSSASSAGVITAPEDDFKYRDLSETISNSTTDGATASSTASSGQTEITTVTEGPPKPPPRGVPNTKGATTQTYAPLPYQPLGIPTLPVPRTTRHTIDYHSDEEGGFRPRIGGNNPEHHKNELNSQFSSFRYVPSSSSSPTPLPPPRPIDYLQTFTSKGTNVALPHGTVRSVKKRRHISFV